MPRFINDGQIPVEADEIKDKLSRYRPTNSLFIYRDDNIFLLKNIKPGGPFSDTFVCLLRTNRVGEISSKRLPEKHTLFDSTFCRKMN